MTNEKVAWETLDSAEIFERLATGEGGISPKMAAVRLAEFGANELPEPPRLGAVRRFLLQFNNALIYVLLAAAVLTAVMAHWVDTWVIVGVVVINAIIGCIQESKAERALDGIRNLLSLRTYVLRSGQRLEIPAEELVIGDVVLMRAGDKIPADVRLISASNFEVDESTLTGESVAVLKSFAAMDAAAVLAERENMAYAGTTVRAGYAIGVVVATADETEIGKISQLLAETKVETTPLMRKMNQLGVVLSIAISVLSVLLFAYSTLLMEWPWQETVLAVIGLAVAAIPEGLPAIITITLAIGVQRMAGKNAIIRRLPSVETLGAVTVICSDKTGTLTKNEMTATNIYTTAGDFEVTGGGYAPDGEIVGFDGKNEVLRRLMQCADLCNESGVSRDGDVWGAQGAPTEAALKVLAGKAGIESGNAVKLADIPFDSKYKYRATLHEIDGKRFIFVVGAFDRLLAFTPSENLAFWEAKAEMAASKGQRLIGLAYKAVAKNKAEIEHGDLEKGLIFAGLVGIIDPPRDEAIGAIRKCRAAGICVKMITGDHALTAREIARQLGLTERDRVISGAELEEMNDDEIREAAAGCDIFARTSPEHKLRLVRALQESGEVVAMTGDGVNDAPALKRADIGVAMGIKGTEVTKDSAEMVLADDNFATIVHAVEEGRTIYDNIKKTLLFLLPTNGAQASVIIAALLFGFTLPVTAVQILWVNMVVAVTLAFPLSFEPAEQNVMGRPPRGAKEPLISGYYLFRILFVTAIVTVITLMFFWRYEGGAYSLAYARTIAVNVLVFAQMFYLHNSRKLTVSLFNKDIWANKWIYIVSGILILLQIGFTYLPFMQAWFGTSSLNIVDWAWILVGGLAVLIVMEIEKMIARGVRR